MAHNQEENHKKVSEEKGHKALATLLAPFHAFVTYEPLRTDVPFTDYVSLEHADTIYGIKPRASLDPVEEARKSKETLSCQGSTLTEVAIFIPGRRFDTLGTRHGQGGGWYDRFLAQVPNTWLRVGFCYDDQFSNEPLVRQSWDQAMDAVCVVSRGGDTMCLYRGKRI